MSLTRKQHFDQLIDNARSPGPVGVVALKQLVGEVLHFAWQAHAGQEIDAEDASYLFFMATMRVGERDVIEAIQLAKSEFTKRGWKV